MNNVHIDVLKIIVQKLPLQQKFQLLTVSVKFEEASSLALKEHESLITDENIGRVKNNFMAQYPSITECDLIDRKCFGFKQAETAKRILSRLPGLKFAHFWFLCDEIIESLPSLCPKLECLSITNCKYHEYGVHVLFKKPNCFILRVL